MGIKTVYEKVCAWQKDRIEDCQVLEDEVADLKAESQYRPRYVSLEKEIAILDSVKTIIEQECPEVLKSNRKAFDFELNSNAIGEIMGIKNIYNKYKEEVKKREGNCIVPQSYLLQITANARLATIKEFMALIEEECPEVLEEEKKKNDTSK